MAFFDDLFFALDIAVEEGHRRCHIPIYYGIQFNQSGVLRLRIGDGPQLELEGAWVFITHPGTRFEYELAGNTPHDYRALCFNGPLAEIFAQRGLLPLNPEPIRIIHVQEFRQNLFRIGELFRAGSHDRAVWALEGLLLLLHEQRSLCELPDRQQIVIDQLAAEIRHHPEREINLEQWAGKLQIGVPHFRRLFKQHTESSPVRYRIRQQLALAAHLLTSSDALVSEIAEQVGIPDEYHFSHLFRKRYGLPPGRFRHLLSFHEKRK